MNKQEIFKKAHQNASDHRWMFQTYAQAFRFGLKKVYSNARQYSEKGRTLSASIANARKAYMAAHSAWLNGQADYEPVAAADAALSAAQSEFRAYVERT